MKMMVKMDLDKVKQDKTRQDKKTAVSIPSGLES